MESEQAQAAIESLNPMMTLRYSATHRTLHHLVHRLDPVRAYDLGLVKRIEVDSVVEDQNLNRPYVNVKSVKALSLLLSGPTREEIWRIASIN